MIEHYAAHGGMIIPSKCFSANYLKQKRKTNLLNNESHTEMVYDYRIRQFYECDFKDVVYLWKPDMQRIFGKLDMMENDQRKRIEAAKRLTAVCLRLTTYKLSFVYLFHKWKGDIVSHEDCENCSLNNLPKRQEVLQNLRPYFHIQIPRIWVPGGPLYASFDNVRSLKGDSCWRPGCTLAKYNRVQNIILMAKRDILSRSPIENIFHFD